MTDKPPAMPDPQSAEASDDDILIAGHRLAWRYKHSTDPSHSSTYTFNRACLLQFARAILAPQAAPASDAGELAYNMGQWREDARTHGYDYVPVHVSTIDKIVKHLRRLPAQQATPDAIREHLEGVASRASTGEQFNAFKWVIDTAFESLNLLPAQQATPEPIMALGESLSPEQLDELWGRYPEVRRFLTEKLSAKATPEPKPFAAPGCWFPVDVLGNPMREFEPGKWEAASWPSAATPEPSRGMIGMGAHALANELAQAVAQDDADPDGHDMSAGLFGPNVSAWLRKISADYLPQPATPEPVGEAVAWWYGTHPRPSIETIRLDRTFTDHAPATPPPVQPPKRPSQEWYRAKIAETLDDDCGAGPAFKAVQPVAMPNVWFVHPQHDVTLGCTWAREPSADDLAEMDKALGGKHVASRMVLEPQAVQPQGEPPASWSAADEAMRWLNEVEMTQGGANGPTIKLRAALLALASRAVQPVPMSRQELARIADECGIEPTYGVCNFGRRVEARHGITAQGAQEEV